MTFAAPTITRSPARVDGIDLLRGLAIFFVMMNHVKMRLLFAHVPYTRGLPPQLVYSLVWNSQRGVQIFSPYPGSSSHPPVCDAGALFTESTSASSTCYASRIAPLFLLLLLVLSALHLAGVTHFVVFAKTGVLGRALLAACTFHINLLKARRGYLPAK